MSFNLNGPSFKPTIQEAQSMKNNGGGGNLGYFQRGKKKKDEEEVDIFDANDSEDTFVQESDLVEEKKEPTKEKKGNFFQKLKNTLGLD